MTIDRKTAERYACFGASNLASSTTAAKQQQEMVSVIQACWHGYQQDYHKLTIQVQLAGSLAGQGHR